MAEEPDIIIPIPPTLKEKILFYVTAFFLLVGIFSAFGFLFLVPFIIEPAYTTIKMDFDVEPAQCITAATESKRGLSNCSWTSCREGCTREVYECTQILVNYMHPNIPNLLVLDNTNVDDSVAVPEEETGNDDGNGRDQEIAEKPMTNSLSSAYDENGDEEQFSGTDQDRNVEDGATSLDRKYKWFYGARLFPNVKGCGYPPYLNCTVFNKTYVRLGTNFSCYFSRADPSLVVSELDMESVHLNLTCAIVVPVVSFIVSIIYLTFVYFYVYSNSKDGISSPKEKGTPRRKKMSNTNSCAPSTSNRNIVPVTPLAFSTPIAPPTSGVLTPASDIFHDDVDSFGHHYKYAMMDDMLSRDSLDSLAFNYSSSMNGNLNKMMTTCILTPPGPIAQL